MKSISLRKANDKDAVKLFNWKNEEQTRRYSIITQSMIIWDKHLEWLAKNIDNIQIIMVDGEEAGDIRIEDNEIAIKIDPKFRKQGIAKKVLELAKYDGMTAKIVEGNEPSMKLFIGAGFTILDFKKGIYTLLYESNLNGVRGK